MVFVKAQGGPPNVGDPPSQFTVQSFDEEGNMTIRSGGKRAWRCNNPGNLVASPYSKSRVRGCIGTVTDGSTEYSIYPDYKTGHEALIVMLMGSVYSPLTLRAAMRKYDSSNPKYIDTIVKITKLDPERTIKSLNVDNASLPLLKNIEQRNWRRSIKRKVFFGLRHRANLVQYG
jgi:hypothetical protein